MIKMTTEQQIEFDKIKEIWSELAITENAKEKIRNATFFLDEMDLKKQLRDTTDSRELIEKLGNPPLQNVTEIKEILAISEKGDCLTPYQLERVERVLIIVERLKDYLSRGKEFSNPIAYYDENLAEEKEYKYKIPGSVIDKSSTGSTYFVEPVGVAKYFEELQMLQIEEENEVYQILYTLTAMVADAVGSLYEKMKLMEKLDFIFSKGKLSLDLNCVAPLINTDRRMVLESARHPLMDETVSVPLQFRLGETERGIVITGPNTGGKTVAIKTVMLNCLMAQCGLHVTCKKADICMNSAFLCDIGDGQNLSENLSTFSAHIKNVLSVLSTVNKDSFVIMDELGSGTDPAEGMGIAIAILEELRKSGANFLVTTHYPEDYDFSIIFDSVKERKLHHEMSRKYTTARLEKDEE